jgi:carbon-monoxide dehydrogenase small subunit
VSEIAVATKSVTVTVNGERLTATVDVRTSLADLLRDQFGLTGTKLGCEQGVCGACTVRLNGEAVRGCLVLAVQAHDGDVLTVEGLGDGVTLTALQRAFTEHHALQCGFCTAGFLMMLTDFLEECQEPTEREIRETLSGGICRCTGYQGLVDAVVAIARSARRDGGMA